MELENISHLLSEISDIINSSKNYVRQSISCVQLVANYEIGRLIVEQEQNGKSKAEYGKYVLKQLSENLIREFGSGFDERNLRNFRSFYLMFSNWNALRSKSEINDFSIWNAVGSELFRTSETSSRNIKDHSLFKII